MKFMRSILVLALLSSGCATSMQMSSEDLNRLTPTEGIVVGSVQIKGGKDILGRTGWTLLAQRIRGPLSSLVPPGLEYSLNASRGGAEEVFVAKMEAGKNVYVGRLIVEFPPGLLVAGTRIHTLVEDVRESTLDTARQKFGLSLGDVITDLMAAR